MKNHELVPVELVNRDTSTVRALRGAAARVASLDPSLARLAEMIHALPESPCAE